jgi:hypothetical protein
MAIWARIFIVFLLGAYAWMVGAASPSSQSTLRILRSIDSKPMAFSLVSEGVLNGD